MTSMRAGLLRPSALIAEGVVDLREVTGLELDVEDRADHLDDLPDSFSQPCSRRLSSLVAG